jgi:hypothetical protein
MRRASLILALSLACGLSSLGCKQGLGQRCEQNSDCESGVCTYNGLTSAMGGTCRATKGAPDSGTSVDALPPTDAKGSDATSDATDAADAFSTPDATKADATTDVSSVPDATGDAHGDADDASGG